MKYYTNEKCRVWIKHEAYVRRLSPKDNSSVTSEIHLEAWDDSRIKRTPQQAAICFVWLLETSKKYNFWCTTKLAESHENLISDSALLYLGCTNGQMTTTALVYTLLPPLLWSTAPLPSSFAIQVHLSRSHSFSFVSQRETNSLRLKYVLHSLTYSNRFPLLSHLRVYTSRQLSWFLNEFIRFYVHSSLSLELSYRIMSNEACD